jgi:hypothetical protein
MRWPQSHPIRCLAPTAEAGNGAPASPAAPGAKPKPTLAPQPIGLSAADLVADIEAHPQNFSTIELPEDRPAPVAPVAPEVKPDAPAAPPEAAPAAAPAPAPEALTPEQTAWLQLRAAAQTPEEAATLDAKAPAFTDAQWAAVEAQAAPESKPAAAPEAQAELTAAQAAATEAKAAAEAATQRVAQLEAELQAAQTQPVAIAPMHPLMTATPEQLVTAENNAVALKEWALKNWDGAPAQDNQPAYSAEQVRAAYARADKHLSAVIPAAKQYHQIFEQENATARQVYPALFDPQSPHYQTREGILRRLPGLKAGLPQISTVMGDAIVGETLRGVLLAETPSPAVQTLRAQLVAAVPQLAQLMPALKGPAPRKGFKLPAQPVVPLARPGSTASTRPATAPQGRGGPTGPSVDRFLKLKAANGGNELEALTESLRNVNVD